MTHSEQSPGQAWASFYVANRRALAAYALALTGNAEDALDLIQDVLLRLLRCGHDPRNAKAYVMRCLRNEAIDRSRRAAPATRELSIDADAVFADQGAPHAPDAESVDLVRRALDFVPTRQREVVVLKIYAEMTFHEIAEATQRPIGSVTSDYARALVFIRTKLSSNPAPSLIEK